MAWIAAHPSIREVLVTGGDPLALSDGRIKWILDGLAGTPSVERIRIGTRAPVVAPMRITPDFAALIASYHQPPRREIIFVTHFEHSSEVTPEAMTAVQSLKSRGISFYNQAVFTFANCRRFEMAALRINSAASAWTLITSSMPRRNAK